MMIRTNLSSVVIRGPREVRPGTIGALVLGVIILLAFVNWQRLERAVEGLKLEDAAASDRDAALGRDIEAANLRAEALAIKIARRQVVIGVAKGRLNWAPLLEKIYMLVPPEMQLSTLRGTCSSANNFTLTIAGKLAAKQPRLECDKFRLLVDNAFQEAGLTPKTRFQTLEDVEEVLQLGDDNYPLAKFTIEVTCQTDSHAK